MSGHGLEQFTANFAKDKVLELSDFLVYVADRAERTDLFIEDERKINLVYHQAWFFRKKLVKNYADKPTDFDKLPAHVYTQYKKDSEQYIKSLLRKDETLRTSVSVPDFLVNQINAVYKKFYEAEVSENEYYVTKKADQYFYDEEPLNLEIGSSYRLAFDIVFDVTSGEGGVCTYEAFNKELQNRNTKLYKKLKQRDEVGKKGLRGWSQDNLTVKTKGVLDKVPKSDLLTTKRGVGFVFNNQK